LSSAEDVRVGVDVGGTFTDFVACDSTGRTTSLKVPTTPANPAGGVLDGLAAVTRVAGRCASLAHGTTLVTNAIVERRVGAVGLVTTRGFGDVLEIGRMNRPHLYRIDLPAKPEPLVPRRLRAEVGERVGPDGSVLAPLDLGQLPKIVERFRRDGVESVAICLLHAYANPAHEQALRQALAVHFPYVSVSSEINAEFREYERTCTTVLNAAVMPLAARYIDDLVARMAASTGAVPIHLLHSAGGMMSVDAARARPLTMAMSGPAAGVASAAYLARTLALPRALAFDMGGTTTDVCLITDGVPETARQRKLGGYPVRLPAVGVESIGAGGGSIAFVDATGALKVGPRSAGAQPGPACYGLGGTEPAVSDANLILGYLNPERIYGGSIRLDRARAERALEPIQRRFGLSLLDAAHAVVEVANANMQRALRLVSVQRGYDLREFTLIAYGGAGPIHAGALAREAGIARIVVPAHSGAFSALGCLVSPLRYDAMQTHRMRLEAWEAKVVADRLRGLEVQCLTPLSDEGHAAERVLLRRSVDLRYAGQNYELEVDYGAGTPDALRTTFERRHHQLYGYATGESVECVNLRVTAQVVRDDLTLGSSVAGGSATAAPVGELRAFFREAGAVTMPRYDRGALPPEQAIAGPALVEDEWSTTLVYPGQKCRADRLGNLLIEVSP